MASNGFLEVVKALLNKWSSLQIAISHGMGGPFAREKEEWLCNVIVDFFNQNSDLDTEEVGEFIEEILNNEFDTLIEDGSLEDICLRLIKYYKWFLSNETDKIISDLETLIVEVPVIGNMGLNRVEDDHMIVPKEQSFNSNGEMASVSATDVANQMQGLSIQSEEPDEWTVVTRHNKKNKPK